MDDGMIKAERNNSDWNEVKSLFFFVQQTFFYVEFLLHMKILRKMGIQVIKKQYFFEKSIICDDFIYLIKCCRHNMILMKKIVPILFFSIL